MADKFTLIDYFKAFHSLKETLNLSAGAQAVYFSILGELNAARFPEQLKISTRELKALAGLKSTNAVIENRNVLKNKKLIDFHTESGVTIYSLSTEHLLNTCRTLTEQSLNGNRTAETNSNIHAREDALEVDVKTIISQSERMSASAFNWNVEAEEKLTALWLENCGAGVTFELLSYFRFIVEKHGVAFCEELIREMAGGLKSDRMTLNYLRGAYNFKLKGGKKSGEIKQRPALTVVPRIKPVAQSVSDEEGDDAYRELLARSASRNESYNPADDIPVDLKAIMGGR